MSHVNLLGALAVTPCSQSCQLTKVMLGNAGIKLTHLRCAQTVTFKERIIFCSRASESLFKYFLNLCHSVKKSTDSGILYPLFNHNSSLAGVILQRYIKSSAESENQSCEFNDLDK